MVNISSPIDGQTFAIEGQEGQDPDEPPIPRPPTSEKSSKQNGSESIVSALPTLGSFGSIAAAWDGNPNTAHTIDAFAVAAYLEVNPSYVLSRQAGFILLTITEMDFHQMKQPNVLNEMDTTSSTELGRSQLERSCFDKSQTV